MLILAIFFNLNPDIGQKQGKFSKILSKKGLKFISTKKNGLVALNLGLLLLPAEVDPIQKKQNYKKKTLMVYSICYIKMIFALSIKIIALHIGATIVQVRIPGLKGLILEDRVCFAIFLTLNKQF